MESDWDKSGRSRLWTTIGFSSIATDGQFVGSAVIIDAANDDEAIAQAEIVRGSFAAELLDIKGLQIVKYLPGTGRRQK